MAIQQTLEKVLPQGMQGNGAPLLLGLVVAVLISAAVFYNRGEKKPDLSHIPILGAELGLAGRMAEYQKNSPAFLKRGYLEYNKKGKAFQIQSTQGPMVVLSAKQIDELKQKPDEIVNNVEPIQKAKMDDYLHFGGIPDIVLYTIKADLTTQLGTLGDALSETTTRALQTEFPPCDDWTPIKVWDKLLRIVAKVSTRIFIGPDLTENDEWLDTSVQYSINIMECVTQLKQVPAWKRRWVMRTLPAYQTCMANKDLAMRLIYPIIETRRKAMDKPGFEQPNDMLQWMLNTRVKRKDDDSNYPVLATVQLELANAAIHTTSMAVLNMMYDLLAMPEYQDMIRTELEEALEKSGGSWNGQFLKGLQKTDSFMKESQRHEPVGLASGLRLIKSDVTLSDGTYLPAGTTTVSNAWSINRDADFVKCDTDLETFDGLRYYKMRERMMKNNLAANEVAGKHQFVSVSNGSLMFGYGRHACPGRFFAGNEIKLILVKILQSFDIKSDEPRPQSRRWESTNTPDMTKVIMMRRRKVAA